MDGGIGKTSKFVLWNVLRSYIWSKWGNHDHDNDDVLNLLNYIDLRSFNVVAMFDEYGYDEDSDNMSWFLEGTKSKGLQTNGKVIAMTT